MALLADLPVELLAEIVDDVFDSYDSNPLDIICINATFKDLGLRLLYTHLRFHSIRQLSAFSNGSSGPIQVCGGGEDGKRATQGLAGRSLSLKELPKIPYLPKTLTVTLSGGPDDFQVFRCLTGVFQRCGAVSAEESKDGTTRQVPLDLLSLCLHSYAMNPHLRCIYEALSLVNPTVFAWTGPDPDHHFSIAIVPTATLHLFRAISTWSSICHITITNLSFPSDDLGLNTSFSCIRPLLPAIPTLRTLYLGQATLLKPAAVAAMVCIPGQDNLESVRLVDAYRESIWGPRIRRGDVERAAVGLGLGKGNEEDIVARVRKLVRCEARTERIMGGDRVEGLSTLE